jgi:hypothetical protein
MYRLIDASREHDRKTAPGEKRHRKHNIEGLGTLEGASDQESAHNAILNKSQKARPHNIFGVPQLNNFRSTLAQLERKLLNTNILHQPSITYHLTAVHPAHIRHPIQARPLSLLLAPARKLPPSQNRVNDISKMQNIHLDCQTIHIRL